MPIDANILLQGRSPDFGNALLKGFQGAGALQEMQIRAQQAEQLQQMNAQKLEQQEYLAKVLKSSVAASRAKPFIEAQKQRAAQLKELEPLVANQDKDATQKYYELQKEFTSGQDKQRFLQIIKDSGSSPEDIDMMGTYADAGRWDQIGNLADQTIQLARDAGVFERDYSKVGGSGYTPAGITYYNKLQEMMQRAKSLPEGSEEQKQAYANVKQLANIIRSGKSIDLGGKAVGSYQDILDLVTIPDITGTGGDIGTGAGAGGPPPDVPTGTAKDVNLEDSIDGKTTPKTAPKSPSLQEKASESAKAIARNQAIYEGAKTWGEKQAIVMSGYENDRHTYQQYKKGIERVFKNKQDQLGDLFKDVPEGSLSSVVNKAVSIFIGGTKGADAEARLKQLSAMLLRGVPYDPGAQSNAELLAREELIGSLKDPNISIEQKKQSIVDYFDMMEARSEYGTDYLKDYYDQNPSITPPKWYREQSAQPAPVTTQTGAPAATGTAPPISDTVNEALKIIGGGQ